MDPFGVPQVHFLVLSFCDLETLKSVRLVSKAWYIASTPHLRQKSIIDLTDSNIPRLVETLDQNKVLSKLHTFPATSFRIRKGLRVTPSFAKFFEYYGPKLIEQLESGVNPFVETFAHCEDIDFTRTVLANLKEFRIARIYNSWEKHSYVLSERIEIRTTMYETLFALAPNLNKLYFDTRLGPSEWLRFMQVTEAKLKQLRYLYFSLFAIEDSDEYFAEDGEFRKDVKLDPQFLRQFPAQVRQLGEGAFKLDSLSWNLLSDDENGRLQVELVQGLFELLGLVKDTLRHLHITFSFQRPNKPDPLHLTQSVESSFPVLPKLEFLKVHFQYTEAIVLSKLPLNKMPSLKRLAISFMSAIQYSVLPNHTIDDIDLKEWLSVFTYPNTSVQVLDIQDFTLVAFTSDILRRISSKFLTLKTLKIDFHPTCKISAENLETIFLQLRKLEKLCIRIFRSSKDFFGLEFPALEGGECKLEQVLAQGWINWTKTFTGIPVDALKLLQKTKQDGSRRIDADNIQNLRIRPSIVDLEQLHVLQIVDETADGILNDEICRFGIMHMKKLKELYLSSTKNISEDCLAAMKQVFDIRKCEGTPARKACSRLAQPINDDDSSNDSC